jgi:tetratricopeptide (TPR) repeat protein
VIELNLGHVLEAISFFEKALKYEPAAAHILYSLAAAHARMGSIEQAVKELKEAVRQREMFRIQARQDSDFTSLYTHPEFQELVGWELVPDTPFPQSAPEM